MTFNLLLSGNWFQKGSNLSFSTSPFFPIANAKMPATVAEAMDVPLRKLLSPGKVGTK